MIADFASSETREKIRILLVEDHPLLRERLTQLINSQPDMAVCGEADESRTAIALIHERSPDMALVDLSLRDSTGFELLDAIRKEALPVAVVVLSMHDEPVYAERALRAGAKGYVNKTESSAQVLHALRKVAGGEIHVNEHLASELLQRMAGGPRKSKGLIAEGLARRELEVFRLIGEGRNTHEIARKLHLGESTIAAVRARIKEKTGAKDVSELYHLATEWMNSRQHIA